MAKQRQQVDEHAKYLRDCITILPEAIQEEFVRVPADLSHWNAQYAEAVREHLEAKAAEKQARARAYLAIREEAAETGQKMTENMLDARVESDASVVAAVSRAIGAESDKARLFGVVDAVRSKKDMLVSLGALLRAEMGGDPTLRREMRDHRTLGDD